MQEKETKLLIDLKERVKELECLHDIERIITYSDKSLEETVAEIVKIIPEAMFNPESASSRIILETREFKSQDFKETRKKLEFDINVLNKKVGLVQVFLSEGDFLEEEKQLLETIAIRLGRFYGRKEMEERMRESNAELEIRVKIRTAELSKANEELLKEISERKRIESALEKSERFLASVFSSIQDGISILDNEMRILRVNPAMENWYLHAMPLVGKKCYQAYHGRNKPCKVCPTRKTLENGESAHEIIPRIGINGEVTGWLDLYSFPLLDQKTGQMNGVIEYVRDISEQKEAQDDRDKLTKEFLESNKRLKELSLTDSLTGLYNYRYLEDALEAEIYRAKRYVHHLALILIDIDYFKSVNDVYGHQFGDLALKQFAQQLRRIVRKYDIVIRFGGEEFIIVSPNIDREQGIILAQRIQEVLGLYNFGDKSHTIKLKFSLAVISYPEDKVNSGATMVNLANKILDRVKERGGNRVYSTLDIKRNKKEGVISVSHKNKEEVKSLQNKIDKLTKNSNQSFIESIAAFGKTIELKDHNTGEHVEHTVHYVSEIAKSLGLSSEEIELLKQASMLHDLGKVGISEKILLKKGKLTKKEFEEIQKHPQIAADILRPIHSLRHLVPLILYHHERWDGKGYPIGLKGEEIPIGARIIALADVYEALTTGRPYRLRPYTKEEAIKIIKEGSGSQFDSRIVKIFLKILQDSK